MAKGKKGGKGKEEKTDVPSLSTLSISESEASTSQAQAAAPAPEEEGGLTSAAARRKAKKAAKAAPLEHLQPLRSTTKASAGDVPAPADPVPDEPAKTVEPKSEEKVEEKEEEGLGLGLGGGGKKKPRKKKPAAPAAAPAAPAAAAAPAVPAPAAAPAVPAPAAVPAPQAPAQTTWGAGRGQGGRPGGFPQTRPPVGLPQQPGPPLGYPQQPAPAPGYPQQPGPPQGPQGYPQPSVPQGYPQQPGAQGPPRQQGPPQGYPQQPGAQGPPRQHGPPQGYPQQPGAQGPPRQHGPPQGYPQQPGAQGPPRQHGPPQGYPQQPGAQGPPRQHGPPQGYPQQPGAQGPPRQHGPPQGYPQQPGAQGPPQRGPPQAQPQGAARPRSGQPEPTVQLAPRRDDVASSPSKTLCRYKIPRKIEGNSVPCREVRVVTNYLQMKIAPLKIYRYDVTFKPDKPKKMISPVFIMVKKKCFPKELIAFDQMKNCYARNPLPGVPQTEQRFATEVVYTDQNNRKINFEVSLKFTGIVDLGTILTYMQSGGTSLNPPTEAIQCVDVILRQGTLEAYIKAGRQFFKRPANPIDLGDGLEMWTGMFQSAIFTTQPFINVDVAHKGFPRQQPLVDALVKDFRLNTNQTVEQQRGRGAENFMSFIKGLRVVAYIGGDTSGAGQRREFIVNGLAAPPSRLSFPMDTGDGKTTQITVADYFANVKKYRLRYPNLNCVWVGPRDKNINYPMELLEVAYGHARNKQLNEMQLSTMVRQAATPPDERKRKIEEVIRDMDYSRNKDFKNFGLEISDKFFPVVAKVLAPPKLETGSGIIEPRNGSWQANRLLKAETLQRWGFIVIEPDMRANCDYGGIISLVMNCGRQMGMTVTEPVVKQFNVQLRDLKNLLFKCLDSEVKFLFIIVPTRGRDYYHKVKQLAEREVGILTQCIKEQTAARRMNQQTARNILLKVNSKLMGINQALDNRSLPACLKSGRVMVVGADVTHPSPDQTSVPSIAAVTASIDPKCFMYNIALSIQTPKKEMIVEFQDMMVEHLTIYKQRNGELPTKIYVFRDGVSEGQFAQVMNSELLAVHEAYQRLAGPQAKPEVLFLLVQKRHHTRLFSGENNPRNVEPGTVVDKHIVHATELDFYLVSHQAIKGTARPTRYHAVCNDGGIKHDEVEQLTYYLCHLYSRCMRSVSYPTPTYYAHLACLRARSLTYDEKFDNSRLEKEPKRLRVLDKMLQYSRMFFV